MVPTLILFFFIQKYMVAGATASVVKGYRGKMKIKKD
jgi:ABC-type maltose transport system permease subunit